MTGGDIRTPAPDRVPWSCTAPAAMVVNRGAFTHNSLALRAAAALIPAAR